MNSTRNKILVVLLVFLVGCALWMMRDAYREEPVARPPAEHVRDSSHCCNLDDRELDQNKRVPETGKKMGRLNIIEHPVDDSHLKVIPDLKNAGDTHGLMTESLRRVAGKFKAMSYTGHMRMNLPTLAKQGPERYGAGAQLESSFWFLKDGRGNFYLRQSTECSRKQSRYNHTAYNGELYYINKTFYFFDAEGRQLEGAALNAVLFRLRNDGQEPLVRRSWIQLIKDLKGSIQLNQQNSGELVILRNASENNGALELETIQGSLSRLEHPKVMKDAALVGAARHGMGFMKGARNEFDFKLEVRELKKDPAIRLP